MIKKLLPALLLITQTGYTQPFNAPLAALLQDTLTYYVGAISNIKGMSASVYIPGQGAWQGVAGVSYAGQPITADMEMGIASNTKLYVSSVMLLLQQEGLLDLDDPLSQWLPAYLNVNPNITIRQLLNHTSGISDPLFVSPWMDTINANPTRVFTPTEVLSWLGAPYFAPGTSWGYSNVNYILAGMIAQAATGNHISVEIRNRILTPLALNDTYYDVQEPVGGTIAHRWWNTVDYHNVPRTGLNTAGGCAGALFSTSGDMAKWYHALFSGQLLNAASMSELTTFVPTTASNMSYGLGLSKETTQSRTYLGHGGSTWGYRSKMIYDTCTQAVVCGLTNSFPSGMEGVTFLLYRVVVNHIPTCSGPISGPTVVMQGQNSVTYTVPVIAHATSYVWTLPSGATGTSSTNSITVNFGAGANSGNITVAGVNIYGQGIPASLYVTVQSVLPLELTDFEAHLEGVNAKLTWTARSADQIKGFVIEYSTDGQWFDETGFVDVSSETQSLQHYAFMHPFPGNKVNYYRLKILENDGQYSYSPIKILYAQSYQHDILVYPNPAGKWLTVDPENQHQLWRMAILNTLGQTVFEGEINGTTNIDIAALPPGLYRVELNTTLHRYSRLIVRQ